MCLFQTMHLNKLALFKKCMENDKSLFVISYLLVTEFFDCKQKNFVLHI